MEYLSSRREFVYPENTKVAAIAKEIVIVNDNAETRIYLISPVKAKTNNAAMLKAKRKVKINVNMKYLLVLVLPILIYSPYSCFLSFH